MYLDDILVASLSEAEYVEDLHHVFNELAANDLIVNSAKCVFGVPLLEILGYQVSAKGVFPLPQMVNAIRKIPAPTSIKELQQYLGALNY